MSGAVSLVTRLAAGLVLGGLGLGGACQRAPEEPSPRPSGTDTGVGGAGAPGAASPSARCIRPTPAEPPPAAKPAASCPPDTDPAPPKLPRVTVEFVDVAPLSVEAELARTDAETSRGLMFRTSMPDEQGMLFRLPRREQAFWMRNTCIPLDMLFIDEDGLIVGVLENVPTLNDMGRSVGCPSTHVLEMNAGWARRHAVKAGQKVLLPSAAR